MHILDASKLQTGDLKLADIRYAPPAEIILATGSARHSDSSELGISGSPGLVCTIRSPRCGICPSRNQFCFAYTTRIESQILSLQGPTPAPKNRISARGVRAESGFSCSRARSASPQLAVGSKAFVKPSGPSITRSSMTAFIGLCDNPKTWKLGPRPVCHPLTLGPVRAMMAESDGNITFALARPLRFESSNTSPSNPLNSSTAVRQLRSSISAMVLPATLYSEFLSFSFGHGVEMPRYSRNGL
jgi:hypothetical protein